MRLAGSEGLHLPSSQLQMPQVRIGAAAGEAGWVGELTGNRKTEASTSLPGTGDLALTSIRQGA